MKAIAFMASMDCTRGQVLITLKRRRQFLAPGATESPAKAGLPADPATRHRADRQRGEQPSSEKNRCLGQAPNSKTDLSWNIVL